MLWRLPTTCQRRGPPRHGFPGNRLLVVGVTDWPVEAPVIRVPMTRWRRNGRGYVFLPASKPVWTWGVSCFLSVLVRGVWVSIDRFPPPAAGTRFT